MQIGTDKIGIKRAAFWSVETELVDTVAVQIGVTRIGAGGRIRPRNASGRVVSLGRIFAITVEEVETVVIRHAKRFAPLARSVALLAVLIVTSALEPTTRRLWQPIFRVLRAVPNVAFNAALWSFPFVLLVLHLWGKL